MPKPIVLVKVKGVKDQNTLKTVWQGLEKKMSDYHVLLFSSELIKDHIELEVFYSKNYTRKQYDELKKIIEDEMSQRM